jgi:predicted amino acid-binding ACT domain protein
VATSTVRKLLAPTSLPADLVDEFLAVSPVWLMGQPAEQLAGDLVLCHPPLAPSEVRALARPTASPTMWTLTVATHDRPGLLAAVAGILADQRLSIVSAATTTLPGPAIALLRVMAVHADGQGMTSDDWDTIGARLRAILGRQEGPPRPAFTPTPPVTVVAHPQDLGRALVTVEAPDRIGLLWAVASWFSENGCNVEACQARSEDGMAVDRLLVEGQGHWPDLAAALSGTAVKSHQLPSPLRLTLRAAAIVGALGAGAVRALTALRRSD